MSASPALPLHLLTQAFRTPQPLCRLGLATRGNQRLTQQDIEHALQQGINFLNWCGTPDALSRTIAQLGERRADVFVCVQFESRTARDADRELTQLLRELNTDWLDALTFYYVEKPDEWRQLTAPGGALEYCRQAQERGQVRWLGLTSHQRRLAAEAARTGPLDLLMIRYNAAHRGAEQEVFPTITERGLPVIAYTCLRWGALLKPTPDDPPDFVVPPAADWYRFVLHSPAVSIALMAPESSTELAEDLQVLRAPAPLSAAEYAQLAAHGQRVRRHAGQFP